MSFFLTNQPICVPAKDYYDEEIQNYNWPKSDIGLGLLATTAGWITTDEDGDAKRFNNHIIANYLSELDTLCKRWIKKEKDVFWNQQFGMMDTLIFYMVMDQCYVLDYASYFGGTDMSGTGECIRHKQLKITGESIAVRYGEEDIYSGSLTWLTDWATPYAEKPEIVTATDEAYNFSFNHTNNKTIRLGEVADLNLTFINGEYPETYLSELSFDSGAVATMVVYYNSGILNWVGTDCTTVDGLSIFQPSANTHYDIVFYFNGTQFVGLVNGYVPSVSR